MIIKIKELANIFLLQNAKVDHSKAIKEYSGSAADKVSGLKFRSEYVIENLFFY